MNLDEDLQICLCNLNKNQDNLANDKKFEKGQQKYTQPTNDEAQYYIEMLRETREEYKFDETETNIEENMEEMTVEEIVKSLRKIKNGKSLDSGHSPVKVLDILKTICCYKSFLRDAEHQPRDWKMAIHKKNISFCAVVKCGKRAERDQVRFFRIPAVLKGQGEKLEALSKQRRRRWPAELEDKDSPDWMSSQNMGYTSFNTKDQEAIERQSRIVNRRKCLKMDEPVAMQEVVEPVAGLSTSMYSEEEGSSGVGVEGQTEMDMDPLNKVFSDLNFCNETIHALQKQLKAMDLSEESFLNNDSKALYFTGFPKADMMFSIFNNVASSIKTIFFSKTNRDKTYLAHNNECICVYLSCSNFLHKFSFIKFVCLQGFISF
ncbi:hypothetical protein NQ314_010708 [Rhamnusium bicolor]|uniref:Uncharacterized protein n=1 Tax=Rhamnusium bicolor TaxID=1586634 RepID=A0AAV8XNH8_9CUCU|nr:hypothetical protein NQ314_010708 [Rhamnusium bicolor]